MIIVFFILQLENLDLEQPIEESSYLIQLEELKVHPINPNRADIKDWLKIPFLSPVTAYRLVEHRGKYRSIKDLSLAGLDSLEIASLKSFIRVGKSYRVRRFRSRIRYQSRMDSLKKYRFYSRTIVNHKAFNSYLVTERDPGEDSYLDYLGYGLIVDYQDIRAGLGRYDIELGEGVVFGPEPFFFLRDYDFQSPRRGIIPYTSVSENKGLYGLALSYKGIYAIISRNKLDAKKSNGLITGIDYSGIHDDSASIANRDLIQEDLVGFGLNAGYRDNIVGFKGLKIKYNPAINSQDSLPFLGDDLTLGGIDLRRYGKNSEIFAELAISNSVLGGIGGFVAKLSHLSLTGAWSHYPEDFYSPHGGMVEEGKTSIISNLQLNKEHLKLGLRGYYQLKIVDQESYYDLRPYFSNRFGNFSTQFELRQRIGTIPSYAKGSSIRIKYKIKRGRIGLRFYERHYPDSKPSIYVGAGTTIRFYFLRITTGIGSFSCPDKPLYVYQPDLPGRFNTEVFSGSGWDRYIVLGINPLKRVYAYLKYAPDNFSLQTEINL